MIMSHLIKQNNKPSVYCCLETLSFGLSRYPLMSLEMNHFISNCYMPVWFLCFCFSAFHRCHITQSCALVRLRRFLPPCPAQPPCLRFSCSSCLHTLLIAIHSTCPANWTKLEWAWLQCWWPGCAPGLCHSVLPSDTVLVKEADLNTLSEGRTKFIALWKLHDYYLGLF